MTDPRQVAERAEQLFFQGYNCCEGVATALAEAMGAKCDCLPALATGMGGGVGHTGNMCGAVTGGAMGIGLAASRKKLKDHGAEKQWANERVAEFIEAFQREFTVADCRSLIHIDFRSTDWLGQYKAGGCKAKCGRFVGFSAEWVARHLAEHGL